VFASRISGSADLYEHSGRRPVASINFVTAHDGFTLRDLVSYNDKHNEANGEDNNDGESHNRSWNLGVEGPTDDPEILAARARQQRNFIATLLLSQGVPMLLHGDEGGRTQQGNNNTYAQDNELSWLHWDELDGPLVEFTARVAQLRRDHPTFRRRRFFTGTTVRTGDGERLNDIVWLHLDGRPMESADWDVPDARSLGMYLNGHGIAGADARGRKVVDDHFLLYFNAGADDAPLTLPSEEYAAAWDVVLDTGEVRRRKGPIRAGVRTKVAARSVVVLREHSAPAAALETSAAASVAAQEQSAAQNGRAGTT
jgi:glycogen operon protein